MILKKHEKSPAAASSSTTLISKKSGTDTALGTINILFCPVTGLGQDRTWGEGELKQEQIW